MSRNLCIAAFVVGLLAVAWVGVGYVGSNPLALAMTLIIALAYGMGGQEMYRFRQATASLASALAAVPPTLANLGDWLDRVHPSLQQPVRLRIEGERIGLPGPALTPYLVGLLVMLGMLGTFLGMVVTLNGAVFALEGTTDLPTMRSSLSAPIRGLGLAFGTSVAGVASSAMLGLISALCRRERAQVAQWLDGKIATVLRGFSLVHQRQETFKALQFQAQALPEVAEKLQAMMAALERQNQLLSERLVSNQESFHRDVKRVYTDLAEAVDQSLKASLSESVRAAGDTIKPVVEASLQGMARQAESLHKTMADGLQESLGAFTATLEQRSASLVSILQADLAQRDQQRLVALTESVAAMAAGLQREWREAGAQTLAQQQQISATLERTATAIGQLREDVAASIARDNERLEERGRIMASLNRLLEGINQGSVEQRAAIDGLVASAAALLDRVGDQFAQQIGAESARMADTATQVASSAVEVASLGEAFGLAVQQFGAANETLVAHLERIEAALDKSMSRSDDQLAYYVAQARELIDLSILSQKQIVDDLRQRADSPAPPAAGAC